MFHDEEIAEAGVEVSVQDPPGKARRVDDALPATARALVVSGRTSFEIVQKALAARIPLVVGVSAPSSLAVRTAERARMTLLGFARDGIFNVYAGRERVLA